MDDRGYPGHWREIPNRILPSKRMVISMARTPLMTWLFASFLCHFCRGEFMAGEF